MYKYLITKAGRKWYDGETADDKKYKAKIEINDISANWIVGQIVGFEGTLEKQFSGGFTKVFIYPCSAEHMKQQKQIQSKQKEQKEIERWLGYVEQQSSESVYENGVNKLRSMELTEEQKNRLNAAINKGTINSLINKTTNYLEYIKNNISEGRWYNNGEKTVLDNLSKLEEMKIDTTIYRNKLEDLKSSFSMQRNIREKADAEKYFTVQRLSLFKGDEYRIGEIVQSNDSRVGKVIKSWKYYEEDTMSFGYMVDGGWVLCAKCDVACVTELDKEEYFKEQGRQRQEEEKRKVTSRKKAELHRQIAELFKYTTEKGGLSRDYDHYTRGGGEGGGGGGGGGGDVLYDTFDIYGGGNKIVIENSRIWTITNNGMDGDDWGRNNIRTGGAGAIGFYMEIDEVCNKYITKIMDLLGSLAGNMDITIYNRFNSEDKLPGKISEKD